MPIDLSSARLAAIRRMSAVDTVRARIALAIELGLVVPGERLPPSDETAVAFGVSEMSVRRGYRMLHAEGFLTRRRGASGGTFVAESPPTGTIVATAGYRADAERVHRLIDERAVLEAGIAHLAASARTDADVAELRLFVRRMASAQNLAEFREADIAFHDRLACAAHAGAEELHRRVSHELYSYFLPNPIEYLRHSNAEHGAIVDAIEAREAASTARLAHDHVVELHQSMYVAL